MKSNPILEELWAIRREIERECDHDLHKICERAQAAGDEIRKLQRREQQRKAGEAKLVKSGGVAGRVGK